MATREEIRTDAVELCEEFGLGWNEATYLIDYLFILLANRGLVMLVERELPEDWYNDTGNKVFIEEQFKKAGYSAWEPLIETSQCECGLYYKKVHPNQKCPRCKK